MQQSLIKNIFIQDLKVLHKSKERCNEFIENINNYKSFLHKQKGILDKTNQEVDDLLKNSVSFWKSIGKYPFDTTDTEESKKWLVDNLNDNLKNIYTTKQQKIERIKNTIDRTASRLNSSKKTLLLPKYTDKPFNTIIRPKDATGDDKSKWISEYYKTADDILDNVGEICTPIQITINNYREIELYLDNEIAYCNRRIKEIEKEDVLQYIKGAARFEEQQEVEPDIIIVGTPKEPKQETTFEDRCIAGSFEIYSAIEYVQTITDAENFNKCVYKFGTFDELVDQKAEARTYIDPKFFKLGYDEFTINGSRKYQIDRGEQRLEEVRRADLYKNNNQNQLSNDNETVIIVISQGCSNSNI